jgi:hypothetical protein
MTKRLTETDRWKKPTFRKLNTAEKLFEIYLYDHCNHAGIWEVDFELAAFYVGQELDEGHIRTTFKDKYGNSSPAGGGSPIL